MPKKLLYVFICISYLACNDTGSGISEIRIAALHEDSLTLNKKLGIFMYHGQVFTGRSTAVYNSGAVFRTIDYVRGKKEGFLVMHYPNGKLSYKAAYKENKLDGSIRSWWQNGSKKSESFYKKGKVHGTQRQWYSSGERFKELNFVDGIENGMQTAWRKNGSIYANYETKNGRIFGLKKTTLCYPLEDEEILFNN